MAKKIKITQTLCALLLPLLVISGPALAQAVFGNITGTVTDPSGAVIPDVVISILDSERGISYEAKTNSSGNFTQTHLISGRYEVRVSAPGFVAFTKEVIVQVDVTTRADIQLQIGASTSSVTVGV